MTRHEDDQTRVHTGNAETVDAGREAEQAPETVLEVLLSRAVAGDRIALDAVRAQGARDPRVLDELSLWQADELRLMRAARELEAMADRVQIPDQRESARWRAGLGWAVAAVLAIALFGRLGGSTASSDSRGRAQTAGLGVSSFESADAAFDAYLERAREEGLAYGEPPTPTLVRSRELVDGGGFEVIVVRTVYERRRTPVLYQLAPIDEAGTIRPIPIRPRTESVR